MKIGSLVRNRYAVPRPSGHHVPPGRTGVVVDMHESDYQNHEGDFDIYVDVVISVDGASVHCNWCNASTFEVIA